MRCTAKTCANTTRVDQGCHVARCMVHQAAQPSVWSLANHTVNPGNKRYRRQNTVFARRQAAPGSSPPPRPAPGLDCLPVHPAVPGQPELAAGRHCCGRPGGGRQSLGGQAPVHVAVAAKALTAGQAADLAGADVFITGPGRVTPARPPGGSPRPQARHARPAAAWRQTVRYTPMSPRMVIQHLRLGLPVSSTPHARPGS